MKHDHNFFLLMEDDPKFFKKRGILMEDDLTFIKWRTTKLFLNLRRLCFFVDGRQPMSCEIEHDDFVQDMYEL